MKEQEQMKLQKKLKIQDGEPQKQENHRDQHQNLSNNYTQSLADY